MFLLLKRYHWVLLATEQHLRIHDRYQPKLSLTGSMIKSMYIPLLYYKYSKLTKIFRLFVNYLFGLKKIFHNTKSHHDFTNFKPCSKVLKPLQKSMFSVLTYCNDLDNEKVDEDGKLLTPSLRSLCGSVDTSSLFPMSEDSNCKSETSQETSVNSESKANIDSQTIEKKRNASTTLTNSNSTRANSLINSSLASLASWNHMGRRISKVFNQLTFNRRRSGMFSHGLIFFRYRNYFSINSVITETRTNIHWQIKRRCQRLQKNTVQWRGV